MKINLAYDQPAPTIHPELTKHSLKMEQQVFKVNENYYLAYGFGIASTHMIVGDDGVILIDPVEDVGKCRNIKAEFDKITNKPVKAIIYTHMHPDHFWGAGAFVSREEVESGQCQIIAHKTMMPNFIDTSTNGIGRVLGLRSTYTFGNYLELGPEGRVNNGIGPDILISEVSLISPTVTVDKELELEISGIKMKIVWAPSECDDEIIVWFPEMGVLCSAEVIQGEAFPNLHTIRGTRYRDPRQWYKSVDLLRSYQADIMVPSHGRPVHGKSEVEVVMRAYRDAIQFVHNQTIRFMNKGYNPDELVEMIALPPHLADHPWLGEFYGTVKHAVREIYQGEIGWFNGDPVTLDPVPREASAQRHIKLMGGSETVLKEAEKALVDEEFQWAAQLATYLVCTDKENMDARHVKAEAFRQLGFKTLNSNWRCWYLTAARELDGVQFDDSQTISGAVVARALPAATKIEAMGLSLAAERSLDIQMTMGFHFSDLKESYALEIRNGIAEFHPTLPDKVDISVALTQDNFLAPKSIEKGLKNGTITIDGKMEDLVTFFGCFDTPLKNNEIFLTVR